MTGILISYLIPQRGDHGFPALVPHGLPATQEGPVICGGPDSGGLDCRLKQLNRKSCSTGFHTKILIRPDVSLGQRLTLGLV